MTVDTKLRDGIIRAAVGLFRTHGYRATSLDRVAGVCHDAGGILEEGRDGAIVASGKLQNAHVMALPFRP